MLGECIGNVGMLLLNQLDKFHDSYKKISMTESEKTKGGFIID